MPELRELAKVLPAPVRQQVRWLWGKVRGNPEFHLLRLMSRPDRLSVDVGANYGSYAAFLARHNKGVVAFEPNPDLAARIGREYGRLGVVAHACALSDSEREARLSIPQLDGVERFALATIESEERLEGVPTRTITVPCRRLDGFDLGPVGLIKIDAEGHELAVLRGAEGLIDRDLPSVLIEVEERSRPGALASVRECFEGRGYRGFMLDRRRLRPVEQYDPARHQDPLATKLGLIVDEDRTYIYNFAFAHDPATVARLSDLVRRGRTL
jgi:FkbM family methyltransferase